ncbi:hypothetical protein [Tepidibacillus sp. LV47]|uniref:hypothetical protein n=1 Tax=Tepidibacillus sp. LV47 TaxID=3398228 RepID=UPI003AAA7FFF
MDDFPIFLINTVPKKRDFSIFENWAHKYKKGIIILSHIQYVGESDFVEKHIKGNYPEIDVIFLGKTKWKGKHSYILGGDPKGKYTRFFRQKLSFRYHPFLFVNKKEAELLYLILKNPSFLDFYKQNLEEMAEEIDLKTIKRGLFFYSGRNNFSFQLKPMNVNWVQMILHQLMNRFQLQMITIWGTPKKKQLKIFLQYPLKKIFIYSKDQLWDFQHKKIKFISNIYSSTNNSDALILWEPKEEFMAINLTKVEKKMKQKIMIDPFYLFEQEEMKALNWNYFYQRDLL